MSVHGVGTLFSILLLCLPVLARVNSQTDLKQQQSNLKSTNIQQQRNVTTQLLNNIVHCRVTVLRTLYHPSIPKDDESNDTKSATSFRQEEISCIPIINGIETDGMYPIQLPDFILNEPLNMIRIRSGSFYLSITNAYVAKDGLHIDTNAQYVTDSSKEQQRRDLQTTTTKTNLEWKNTMTYAVIRISTTTSSPTDTAEVLRQTYTNSNGINFGTQYSRCSFGQLQWVLSPVGVIDVTVNQPMSNFVYASTLIEMAQNQIAQERNIGSVSELADKIIICVPPGTGDWAARASINHWKLQLNNNWCRSLSATMHELGHTMGLSHANANNVEYNDRTDVMSYGIESPNGPLICFNAYNSYLFGWYRTRHFNYDPRTSGTGNGILINLATFVDFDRTTSDEPVVINIADVYYLQYNRAKSFNSDVLDKKNQVTITTPGTTAAPGSNNLIGLSVKDQFVVNSFLGSTGSLIIAACSTKVGGNGADMMVLSIGMDISLCSNSNQSVITLPVVPTPIVSPVSVPVSTPISVPSPVVAVPKQPPISRDEIVLVPPTKSPSTTTAAPRRFGLFAMFFSLFKR